MTSLDKDSPNISETKVDNIKKKKEYFNISKKTFIVIFGIILPIITLLVELTSKFCAETLLNPIPTYNHAFLIFLVPLFNLLIFSKFNEDKITTLSKNSWIILFSGITISISFYYSLLFLPFSLVAIFAIVFMGLGFLPLSPFLSFISSLICTYTLIKKSDKSISSNLIKISFGALIGFIIIFLIELQCLVTNYAMIILDRHDHERKIEGLELLRKYGDLEKIKRSYYTYHPETSDIIMTVLGYPKPYYVDISKIYYFLTGEFLQSNRFDSFTERLPNQLGSSKIGLPQPQLYLSNSNLDVISNPEKGYYYTEWTINFKNKAIFNQESRAEIRLPENSVVSKASLWVNGIEKQAVFAGKKEVTQAYQKIVNKSRDPLLVNYSGQDRILIQCFPVPANDGEIKIRLGITSSFNNDRKQEIVLPKFIATNFNIEDKTKHNFMLESKTSLTSKPNFDLSKENNVYNLSASLSNSQLEEKLDIYHNENVTKKDIFIDPINNKNIIKTIFKKDSEKVDNIIFAIDPSIEVSKNFKDLAENINNIPNNINIHSFIASDNIIEINKKDELINTLNKYDIKGGFDNTEMLVKAYEYYTKLDKNIKKNTKIVWIHSPQPDFFKLDSFVFEQKRRKYNKPVMYELQIGKGLDSIIYDASEYIDFKSLESNSLKESINKIFNNESYISFKEESNLKEKNVKEDLHISKLWAYQKVEQLLKDSKYKEALNTAMKYQIITPISGAVVLESDAQYEETGLKESKNKQNNNNVPIIPEPHEWALIIIAALFILFYFYKNQKTLKIKF